MKDEQDEQAACAHVHVNYVPIDNGDGTTSTSWVCASGCGCFFSPIGILNRDPRSEVSEETKLDGLDIETPEMKFARDVISRLVQESDAALPTADVIEQVEKIVHEELTAFIRTHIAAAEAAAYLAALKEVATNHDNVLRNCRCGKLLNDYETDDVTWSEHIAALPVPQASALDTQLKAARLDEAKLWDEHDLRCTHDEKHPCWGCKRIAELERPLAERPAKAKEPE